MFVPHLTPPRRLLLLCGLAAVVGVAAGFGAQDRDGHVRERVPVGIEVVGTVVEEGEPCDVRGLLGHREHIHVERASERVADAFRRHNVTSVDAMLPYYQDEGRRLSMSKQGREELERQFARDQERFEREHRL